MPQAVAICTPVTDHMVLVEEMPQPNQGAKILAQSWQCGGNAATAAVTCARQGMSAGVIGFVGNDANGRAQYVDFAYNGVETTHLYTTDEEKTLYTICLCDLKTKGRSFISEKKPGRQIREAELDLDYIRSARYLFLDVNTPATRAAAKAMREKGGEVIYDASLYRPEHEQMLPYSTIYIASEFYYRDRYGAQADVFHCCQDMRRQGPHTVIFTLGERGCAGIGPEGSFALPACAVDRVVDTTGCGDPFHGAFVVGKAQGWSTIQCAQWATASAAIKCQALGGRAAQADFDTVARYMQTGQMDLSFLPQRIAHYAQQRLSLEEI